LRAVVAPLFPLTQNGQRRTAAIRDRQKLGTLKPDPLPLENIAKYRKKASELVDKINTLTRGPSS